MRRREPRICACGAPSRGRYRNPPRDTPNDAVAIGAATLFALVLVGARGGSFDRLDWRVRRAVFPSRHDASYWLMHVAGLSGEPAVHVPLALIMAWRLGKRRRWREGAPLVAASLGTIAAHNAIKLFYKRRRPPTPVARGKKEPAFPSGHTTQSTAVSLAFASLAVRERKIAPALAWSAAAAVPLLTGTSRLRKDEHWFSDVVGGLALGVVVWALSEKMLREW